MNIDKPTAFIVNLELYYFRNDLEIYFPKLLFRTDFIVPKTELIIVHDHNMIKKDWFDNIINQRGFYVYDELKIELEPEEIVLSVYENCTYVNGYKMNNEIRMFGGRSREQLSFRTMELTRVHSSLLSNSTFYKHCKKYYGRNKPNTPLIAVMHSSYYGLFEAQNGMSIFKGLNDWLELVIFKTVLDKQPSVTDTNKYNNNNKITDATIEKCEREIKEQRQYYETIINELTLKTKDLEIDNLKLKLKYMSK